ncbi:MAG: alpha/beta hydrolase family protein [Marinobacter sp.]
MASQAGIFWLQSDPDSGVNRVWWIRDQASVPLTTLSSDVRSRVNGYGGGALAAAPDGVFIVGDGQQICFIDSEKTRSQVLTTDAAAYGGLVSDPLRQRVLAVRETGEGVANGCQQLMALARTGGLTVLHEGEDFYGAPALTADGKKIAWVTWQLPDMPWLRTRLWTAEVTESGTLEQVQSHPSPNEGSIQQPVFSGPALWVLSDHEGWWQPWQVDYQNAESGWLKAVAAPERDHANAPWQLGERHHCPLPGDCWARVCYHNGYGELWLSGPDLSGPVRISPDFNDFRSLCTANGMLYAIAKSPHRLDAVLRIDPLSAQAHVIAGGEPALPGHTLARPVAFRTPARGPELEPPQGFFYAPLTADKQPAKLILVAHGGPTSAAYPVFNPQIQFWCQRGFAVAEVNYRGSSGFGRAFRLALAERWGELDVEDMARAVDYLVDARWADPERVFIQGRSSGGYTALMALSTDQRYSAGASLFGVTDPAQLRRVTHRFESGYLDWLLGDPEKYPQRWQMRTPRLRAAEMVAPVIFFQGGQDKVVVPEQTRAMVSAMHKAGQAPELHWFEDEGHGFLQQANQAAMLEGLYRFYQRHSRKADECAESLS